MNSGILNHPSTASCVVEGSVSKPTRSMDFAKRVYSFSEFVFVASIAWPCVLQRSHQCSAGCSAVQHQENVVSQHSKSEKLGFGYAPWLVPCLTIQRIEADYDSCVEQGECHWDCRLQPKIISLSGDVPGASQ